MALISLQELIEEAQDRADQLGSDFISEVGWKRYINKGLGDLYDLLVANYGDDYFTVTGPEVSVAASAGEIPLPSDFYKLVGIERKNGGCWVTLNDFQFAERSLIYENNCSPRYCLQADKMLLRPEKHSAVTVRFIYIKEFSKLSDLSDTFNFKSSWDDFVICKAALKARDKEEGDVSVIAAELQKAEANIIKMAPNRDANRPKRVIDVESVRSWDGWPAC